MPLQYELTWLVKQRCEEIGLTPQRLAEIASVGIDTVRRLLGGEGGDMTLSDAECIANAVGLSVGVTQNRHRERSAGAAAIASRTASTSFRDQIPPDALIQSLITGIPPTEYRPHIRALLEEAPLGLLADLAYQLNDRDGTPPSQTWQTMRQMALTLACIRPIWH